MMFGLSGESDARHDSSPSEKIGRAIKLVYLIRHGESTYNARRADGMRPEAADEIDPPLTSLGMRQARALASKISDLSVELVATSPLKRALETANYAIPEALNLKRVVLPMLREQRRIKADFLAEELQSGVAVSHGSQVEPTTLFVESDAEFKARVTAFREWLSDRPETKIAVIGHGRFFECLTGGQVLENCAVRAWGI